MVIRMKAVVKVKKIGGSFMVRVPKDIVEAEGIMPGDFVRLTVLRKINAKTVR